MADSPLRSALRRRWQAEFGDRFTAEEYETALDDVETFRRCARRLAHEPVDNGEMPFSNLLPPLRGMSIPKGGKPDRERS